MKKICYILIPFFILGSHLIADCTADQTFIEWDEGIECYHTADLAVLRQFAENSNFQKVFAY